MIGGELMSFYQKLGLRRVINARTYSTEAVGQSPRHIFVDPGEHV
jgi:hypothetical protein